MRKDRDAVIRELVDIQYSRNDFETRRGSFRVRGDTLDIFAASAENLITRVSFFGDEIEKITEVDYLTGKVRAVRQYASIFPATHYATTQAKIRQAAVSIEAELEEQLSILNSQGKLVEAYRLEQRTRYDLEMLRETGFCKGIENYSRHLSGRSPGSPPFTLLDFFPDDYLLMIDESHVTIPQIGAMYNGDRSRKQSLVEYGFRLPSAFDNRPLTFDEFEQRMGQALFVSATPSRYEEEHAGQVVEQIIRPTGLIDPEVIIRPVENQIEELLAEIARVTARGERTLVLTLTKKMAEDLTAFLKEENLRVQYLHSDIDTVERLKILKALRQGQFDVLVGINLLREGLDLPEVSLIAILDADKEGFLRSTTSLVQMIGRAARNINGQVIMYADKITDSMRRAIDETTRRRKLQQAYNEENHITPVSVKKDVRDVIDTLAEAVEETDTAENLTGDSLDERIRHMDKRELNKLAVSLEREMKEAARKLAFEEAAQLRDLLVMVKGSIADKR
jgi:excinuclease ABC subunit B